MRALAAVLAAAVLFCAGAPALSKVAPTVLETAAAQYRQGDQPAETTTSTREEPAQDSGDEDGGGVPIWAGIGLILLAAFGGSMAARARNRRRMRQFKGE